MDWVFKKIKSLFYLYNKHISKVSTVTVELHNKKILALFLLKASEYPVIALPLNTQGTIPRISLASNEIDEISTNFVHEFAVTLIFVYERVFVFIKLLFIYIIKS